MTEVRYYAQGQQVDPIGGEDNAPYPLVIDMEWLDQKTEARIEPTVLTFDGADGAYIRQRAFNGGTGGIGIFEGMPFSVQVGEPSNFDAFDMYIDFTKNLELFGECGVNAPIQEKQGTNWLNDVADGIPFKYLQEIGVIQDSDFYSIPYVVNYKPDGAQLLILGLATFALTKELSEAIKAIADRVADLTDAATPVIGAGVTGPVVSYDIGNIILASLKLVAQIAYTVGIVISLFNLISQIVEEIMPPKRYHKGIGVYVLVERFCQHLGLTLRSDLLDSINVNGNKWCYIPPKNHRGGKPPTGAGSDWRETGLPSSNSPIYTVGGLIRELKKVFNADFKISNGVFYFERKDGFNVDNPYIIPSTFVDQENLRDVFTLNTSEIWANYAISWTTDVQDQNTLDNVEGLAFQAQTKPIRTSDPRLSNVQGAEIVNLPFSLPVRKDSLSAVEQAVKALVSLFDLVSGQLGNPQSLTGRINNRIGAMNLSSDFTNAGKFVVMAGSNLQEDQRGILGADQLWDNYHYINTFAEYRGESGQYYIYQNKTIPFCFEDYRKIKQSNRVLIETGEQAEISSLKWDIGDNTAVIDYRVKRIYDNNLEVVIL